MAWEMQLKEMMKSYLQVNDADSRATNPSPGGVGSASGFTLVEVVIAIVVLVIGISATILVMNTSLNRAASGDEKMRAMHIGRNQLETLRNVPFNHSALNNGLHTNAVLGISYLVTEDSGNENLKEVTVNAGWFNHVRRTNQVLTITTVLCDPLH